MMKYLRFETILCSIIFLLPAVLTAQDMDMGEMGEAVEDTLSEDNFNRVDASTVQAAFRKVSEEDLMGGISVVNLPEIMEKSYMTFTLDNMQALVGGFTGSMWGMGDYLVLVDGIPRDPGSVNPAVVKQITFLKGVSANVLYGSQASNGVINITTKRGGNHDLQINGRIDGGINVPKRYPNYLGSAEYMTLYNEARANDGLSQQFSTEQIYRHSTGEEPYRYPSVDYYSPQFLEDFSNRYHGNVEISGGSETARYYTNINFISSGSLLNFGPGDEARGNNFNIRGNIDFELNDNITASVDAGVIYDDQTGANVNYWGEVSSLRPHRYTPLIPISMFEENNPNLQQVVEDTDYLINDQYILGGTQLTSTNPIAGAYAGGTNESVGRQYQFSTAIDMDLKGLLEGLKFRGQFGVDYQSSFTQAYNNEYAVYQPNWVNYNGNNRVAGLTQYGQDASTGVQNVSSSTFEQTLAFSGRFSYDKTLPNDQEFSAMLLANAFQITDSGIYHATGNANLGLQLKYNYQQKYYVDFSAAVPHSAKLPEGSRQAFSPTATLGWRISEENFMADDASAIDNLMLYVSGGIVNTDMGIPGYHLYKSSYDATGTYFGWRDGLLLQGTESRRGANPDLRYVKRKELNAGIDASFFDNLISVNGSVFLNRMDGGVVQTDALYPSYFFTFFPDNSFIPYVNYNIDERRGIDFNVRFNERLAGIDWSLGMTGTLYDSEAIRRAEVNDYEYQNAAGKPLDALWGLESNGFFMDQNEIDNSPSQQFGDVEPGDLQYVNQNPSADEAINSQDQVFLGKAGWNGAPVEFGVNLTARWNNFTLFALGTGQFGAYGMKSGDYYWVNGEDKYSAVVRDRWTEETKNSASYPRLTTGSGNNNFRNSSFWMYSTDRFDLEKVQVTYDLPQSLLQNSSLRQMQVYVSGANLLTISPNSDIMELNVGSAPQMRFFNVGIKANF